MRASFGFDSMHARRSTICLRLVGMTVNSRTMLWHFLAKRVLVISYIYSSRATIKAFLKRIIWTKSCSRRLRSSWASKAFLKPCLRLRFFRWILLLMSPWSQILKCAQWDTSGPSLALVVLYRVGAVDQELLH